MKNRANLLRSILSGAWFIEPNEARSFIPYVVALIKREQVILDEDLKTFTPASVATFSGVSMVWDEFMNGDNADADDDAVSLIPLIGPIVKYDTCFEYGTKTRAQQLLDADADPRIKGHVILFDTGGGEALATELMFNAIKSCTKPVVGVVEGMMCSAGVWIGCACDMLLVSGESSIVGSIGTMITLPDFSGMLEKEGIKLHEIYADDSTDKNKDFRDAIQGDYTTIKNNLLNPLNDVFKTAVINNRPSLNIPETTTGKTFLSLNAITYGLVDEMGNVQTAINKIMSKTVKKVTTLTSQLAEFKGKVLTTEETAKLEKVLAAAGLSVKLAVPVSLLYDAEGGKKIYVYANDGEDPTGKRCVYADDQGSPTEENVEAGDHTLADGQVMTVSINETDGFSYVDSLKPAGETEEEDAAAEEAEETEQEQTAPAKQKTKTPVAKTKKPKAEAVTLEAIGALVDQKLKDFRSEFSFGKTPTKGNNGVNTQAYTGPKKGGFAARMKEIQNKTKTKKQ